MPGHVPSTTEPTTPATPTETVLAGLYAAVLNRDDIGATDGFFDLGGNSIQAMRLVSMIDNRVGADVGVAAVFLHPTPRRLAAKIDATTSGVGTPASAGPLVELSRGAGELPLFLIHAIGGTVSSYTQLACELASTFQVHGIQAPGLTQPAATAASLAGLADDYTERIRAAQPDGPYRLAGWSMGGVIAFEIARRLEQADAEVSLLVLLDAPFTIPDDFLPAEPQLAARFLADAARSLAWDNPRLPDPATATVAEQLDWLAGRLGTDSSDRAEQDTVAARLRNRFDVFQQHTRLLAGYEPAGAAVRAPALIVSANRSPNAPARVGWPGMLCGPVSTLRVDGDHYAFLRPPLVTDVGTAILKWHAGS